MLSLNMIWSNKCQYPIICAPRIYSMVTLFAPFSTAL